LVELFERQRIVEERSVDDASRDCPLVRCEHHAPTAPAATIVLVRRTAATCSPTTQAAVRNTSVPSVAHAAPSIDNTGTSCALSARLTSSAAPQAAAYHRSPLHRISWCVSA